MLSSLIHDVWRLYERPETARIVVRPSIPILFFGDSQQYFASGIKAITVGLNPSRREFPADAPFDRFRHAQSLYPAVLDGGQDQVYLAALNNYFHQRPYTSWFSCFEPVLNGMDCSYYRTRPNTALQTELCSPLATDPTWSGLSRAEHDLLMHDGVALWHRLVEYLAPDVILISVARAHLAKINFEVLEAWKTFYNNTERKDGTRKHRPYQMLIQTVRIGGKSVPLIFGPAARKPFGHLSNAAKHDVGSHIASLFA